MKNPLIFLDVDGVLNHREMLIRWVKKTGDNDALDIYSLRALQKIIDASGADVVISSTWRMFYTDDALKALLLERGLKNINIIGQTPEAFYSRRGEDILRWLQENNVDEAQGTYLILDDDTDVGYFPELKKHWVQTYYHEDGLRNRHVARALEILGVKK